MNLPVPTVRLALLAAAGAVLIVVLPDLGSVGLVGGARADVRFLVVDAVVGLLAVVDVALAPSPARVGVVRHLPSAVVLGHAGEVRWEVTNPTARPGRIWLADELAPSLGAARRRVELRVPARSRAEVAVELRPRRRGRFQPREVVVRTAGPLGLVQRQRRRCLTGTLRVLPPFRSVKEAELRLHQARVAQVGLRSAKGRGGGTEFDALRELTPDDETRRIDWAATARTGRPIVRTYRAERNQTVVCLLDSGRTMAGRVDGVPRLDHGFDAVLMVAELATGLGDKVGLVAFDQQVRRTVAPSASRSQRARITDALFDLEPGLVEADHGAALAHVMGSSRRRRLLILVTELAEHPVEQFLLPALARFGRSHVVVVAAVVDPEVARWADEGVGDDPDSLWRRAAAIATLDERRRVADRVRALGATVVDAEPGRLAAQLGDTYLHIKAVGRL